MELYQQEIIDEFIHSIREEYGVSIKSIYDFKEKNKNEIDNIDDIFDSDDPSSVKKRLVLLSLISRDRATENLTYYCDAKDISQESLGDDIKTFKILILAALLYNNVFFVSSLNWRGLIQREISRIKEKNKDYNVSTSYKNAGTIIILLEEYKRKQGCVVYYNPLNKAIMFATGDSQGFESLQKMSLKHDGISGILDFSGDDQYGIMLEFIFDEPQEHLPFNLEFCFSVISTKTKHDKYEKEIIKINKPLKNEKGEIISIKSEKKEGIDYFRGIPSDYNLIVIPSNTQ
jgi:hypothetical protein